MVSSMSLSDVLSSQGRFMMQCAQVQTPKTLWAPFPRTAGASVSHSRPRPALGTPTVKKKKKRKRKHAPSRRMEVSNFIPLIIDSGRLQHSRSAPAGPRSVRNTLHKKGDGVSGPRRALWTRCVRMDRQGNLGKGFLERKVRREC